MWSIPGGDTDCPFPGVGAAAARISVFTICGAITVGEATLWYVKLGVNAFDIPAGNPFPDATLEAP